MNYTPQISLEQVVSNLSWEISCPNLPQHYVEVFQKFFKRLPTQKEIDLKLKLEQKHSNIIFINSLCYTCTYLDKDGVVCSLTSCTQIAHVNPEKMFEKFNDHLDAVYVVSLITDKSIHYDIIKYPIKSSQIISITSMYK